MTVSSAKDESNNGGFGLSGVDFGVKQMGKTKSRKAEHSTTVPEIKYGRNKKNK